MKIDMNGLKVVFDYVGKYKNVISMMMYKDKVEKEFVELYNVYCDITNPRYENWNTQWSLEHEFPTEDNQKPYLEFMNAKQEECIRENESLFKSDIFKSVFVSDNTFSAYVNSHIGTFVLSFHLENK